ncbi:DUF167 domain-containing protein [Methanobrevibacter sp. OttesenSCG-928-K11]|nr:DUF167 domain-containing protein [Methanobrevibacter sp. OttesenSCG-928-K11]
MTSKDYYDAIKIDGNNILIDIEVSPNSKNFTISGFNVWRKRFEIKIKAIPTKGKANKEIIKFFSKIFNCNVTILKGEKSQEKTIILYDISEDDFFSILKKYNL